MATLGVKFQNCLAIMLITFGIILKYFNKIQYSGGFKRRKILKSSLFLSYSAGTVLYNNFVTP